MNNYKKYTTDRRERKVFLIAVAALAVVVIVALAAGLCRGEEQLATCWILCKPGSQVNVRRTPDRNAQIVGFLEVGDEIRTDGVSSDGWIRCYGIGEYGEGWVYCGYVAE